MQGSNRYVLIVAGGKGLRMGGDIPKQFLSVQGRPLLMHTLDNFHRFDGGMPIILVLPEAQQDYWTRLCREYGFRVPHEVVSGGETRFHSVRNGLDKIKDQLSGSGNHPAGDDVLVAVHDGVRPFVSHNVIEACFEAAVREGAAIPVIPVIDTLREVQEDGRSRTVSRSQYRQVQTPQTFQFNLLAAAYAQPYSESFTDDASVVEAYGHPVALVDGNRENIKITTPYDLAVAEAIIR